MTKTIIAPESLRQWCADRRGRASAVASLLGCSREFVRQLAMASRPIPPDTARLLRPAMQAVVRHERETYAAALARVKAGVV